MCVCVASWAGWLGGLLVGLGADGVMLGMVVVCGLRGSACGCGGGTVEWVGAWVGGWVERGRVCG